MSCSNKLLNRNTKGSERRPSHYAVILCISVSDGGQRGWWESVHPSRLHHHTKWYWQLLSHRSSVAQGLQRVTAGSARMLRETLRKQSMEGEVRSGQNRLFIQQVVTDSMRHEMKRFNVFLHLYRFTSLILKLKDLLIVFVITSHNGNIQVK